ncbi:MAG TPA: YjjG family noncanonical pyrimidine nucleotidase [Woeseiaceae bacterium]|nr:YjjG family noncanonical pyrimidine nucleotidase [Woeseiaceae bacterium]
MHYSTFLIDLDHTLFDSDSSETAAFLQAMNVAGIARPDGYEGLFRRINLELWAAVERGETTPQYVKTHRFERLALEAGLDADPVAMADAYVAGLGANGELYAGAREVLDILSCNASMALVTNGLSEVQRRRIERTGIVDYFDAVIISAEVGVAKPAAEIFDIAFAELDAPSKESALIVGDNLASDILGGTNYGIATCWYNPKRRSARPADRISHEISALNELLHYVGIRGQ